MLLKFLAWPVKQGKIFKGLHFRYFYLKFEEGLKFETLLKFLFTFKHTNDPKNTLFSVK